MVKRALVAVITVVFVSAFCRAADNALCPSTVKTNEQLAGPVMGWTVMQDDAPHQLAGITFFDGPPAEKASLVYDAVQRGKSEHVATWTFDAQSGRDIWVACSYSGTNIELMRSLPRGTHGCSVTYDPQQQVAGLPVIKKVSCK